MREIEVKIFGIDAQALEQRLKDAGATLVFDGEIDAIQFDFPDFALRRKGRQARIRRIGGKVEMVVKGPRDDSGYGVREEIETYVDDFETARLIFDRLGLIEMCRYCKQRRTYKLDGIKYEFDTYPNYPTLLEVEAKTKDDVRKGVEFLGFAMQDTYDKSFLAKLKEEGLDEKDMGFELSKHYDSWRQAK